MSNSGKKKTGKNNSGNSTRKQPVRSNTKTKSSVKNRKENELELKELEARKTFMKKEAAFVCISFIALFLFISNFGILGKVGAFFSGVQKGLFGFAAYVFPIALVYVVYFCLKERKNVVFWLKIISDVTLLVCICSELHLLLGSKHAGSFGTYYDLGKVGELYHGAAGGAIGGFVGDSLLNSIAAVGAWLLLIALSILCIVVITEKSAINAARKSAETAQKTAKQGRDFAREKLGEERVRMEARREANELRRKESMMEKDLRRKEAEMPSPGASVFDLRSKNVSNQLNVPDPLLSPENDYINLHETTNAAVKTDSVYENDPQAKSSTINTETFIDEPDYTIDDVPFAETAGERYKAYGKMLNGEKIDLSVAEKMGFAVSRDNTIHPVRSSYKEILPKSMSAFESQNEAPNLDFPQKEGDFLHRPLDPEEIVYPDLKEIKPEAVGYESNLSTQKEDIVKPSFLEESKQQIKTDFSTGYDDMFHITDEDRDNVYNEREKAAKEDETYTPFGNETFIPDQTVDNQSIKKPTAEEAQAALDRKRKEEQKRKEVKVRPYQFPPVTLLKKGVKAVVNDTSKSRENARKLEQVLSEFGVGVTVTNVVKGPRVTRYEMTPDVGVKVSRITSLAGDIKLALAASELRIEAPIPGKSAVGIEVPNDESATVTFRDIMETDEFRSSKSKLTWGVGLDIQGSPIVGDIAKMPHLLVSGTTGSGKSVGINSIIMSVIYRSKPEEVKMILVDPKVVELSVYDGIPHLLAPVVTKPDQALAVLNKACAEMQHRYNLFKESNTRNIIGYNEKVEEISKTLPDDVEKPQKLPYILIIIDELSELMMHSKRDVEAAIVSLTQLARAAGIHLVVATQRPSVDVVTGLIKSNIPSRVAYRLPSGIDSRTILDSYGAETLLGNGDMLYKPGNINSPLRVQGAYLSDGEVEEVVDWLKKHNSVFYDDEWENLKTEQPQSSDGEHGSSSDGETEDGRDEYFVEAGILITEKKKASIGLLQRKFKIGFNRASRIMEQLNEAGVVSEGEGTKERQILMSPEEFREKF